MAFLTVNGWTIEVLDNERAEATALDVRGDFSRSFSGRQWRTARASKRRWQFETRPMIMSEVRALTAIIEGRGHAWRGAQRDGSASANTVGGLAPQSGAVYTLLDGKDAPGVHEVLYHSRGSRGRSFAIEEGTTNLLSSNVATATDTGSNTTGFTAVDSATLASSTAKAWQASRSLKVDTAVGVAATRSGAQTDAVAASATTAYCGSVYLLAASGTPQVRVYLRDVVNGIDGTPKTVTLSATQWTRVEDFTVTTGGGSPTVSMFVLEETADTPISFYADGLQIEAKGFSTAWVNGTRADGSFPVSPGIIQDWAGEITIVAVTTRPDLTVSAPGRVLLNIKGLAIGTAWANVPRIRLDIPGGGTNRLDFKTIAKVDGAENTVSTGALSATGFDMIVAVLNRDTDFVGASSKRLYLNGVLAGESGIDTPDFVNFTVDTCNIGGDSSSSYDWSGAFIDSICILPFAAPASLVAAWWASAEDDDHAWAPLVKARGSFIDEPYVFARGKVDDVRTVGFMSGSSFVNGGRVSFSLEEV